MELANLSTEDEILWKILEEEKKERIKEGKNGFEITRKFMPFVNHSFARIVRSLPSDKSIDHGDDGMRLFDFGRVTEKVLVGRVPRNMADFEFLRENESVGAVVSLSEDWELQELGWQEGAVAKAGMCWIQLPTPVRFI